MALPPLAPIPNLRRLLTPEEILLYTVKFHPLRGWPWLLGALACMGASYIWPLTILPCAVLAVIWYIPFTSNEVAVTNNRLLLRIGQFKLLSEAIEDENLVHWKLEQGILGVMLHTGTVILRIRYQTSVREITIPWIWHPITFLESLQALQDEKFRPEETPRAAS
ncbi:MAG: hypothetical protein DI585_06690 [Pseudomonas fluorescens]|nr:MAG: hypothetical protein DI585_06690 [Pseudomonas fluorescens]